MSVHEYRSGGWTAIVAEDGVALMDPGVSPEVARELWQLTSAGRRLGAWVEYLAGAGIATLPAFAMVEAHDGRLRVLVRGDVEITTAERTVSGRGYTTWREEVLDAATEVTLSAQPGTGAWLPITGGIVAASAIRFGNVGAAELVLDDEEDVELTVARMPALAAFTGATPGSPAAMFAPPPAATGPTTPVAPAVVPEVAAPQDDVSQVDVSQVDVAEAAGPGPEAVEPNASEPDVPEAEAGTVDDTDPDLAPADAATDVVARPDEDDDAAESDEYDHLLWSTEQAKQHTSALAEESDSQPAEEAAPQPAPVEDPATPPAVDPLADGGADPEATQAPDPDPSDGWHSGGPAVPPPAPAAVPAPAPAERPGLIDSVPGLSRPAPVSNPPAPQAPGGRPPAPVGRPVDLPPPSGVPEPYAQDDADDGDHDGETILASDLPGSDVPIAEDPVQDAIPEIELVLPNGPRVELTRPVLLGRAPEASRFVGGEAPRLVSVPNPEKDVSGTHVEVRPAGSHVVVTDMNSTNGTVVTLPGQPAFRLQPGTGVPVPAGAVIELGVGVTVRVALVGEEA